MSGLARRKCAVPPRFVRPTPLSASERAEFQSAWTNVRNYRIVRDADSDCESRECDEDSRHSQRDEQIARAERIAYYDREPSPDERLSTLLECLSYYETPIDVRATRFPPLAVKPSPVDGMSDEKWTRLRREFRQAHYESSESRTGAQDYDIVEWIQAVYPGIPNEHRVHSDSGGTNHIDDTIERAVREGLARPSREAAIGGFNELFHVLRLTEAGRAWLEKRAVREPHSLKGGPIKPLKPGVVKVGGSPEITFDDDGAALVPAGVSFDQLLSAFASELRKALMILETWPRDGSGNYSPRHETAGDLSGSFQVAWENVTLLSQACIGIPATRSLPPAGPNESVRKGRVKNSRSIHIYESRLRQVTFALAKWSPGDLIFLDQVQLLWAVLESLPLQCNRPYSLAHASLCGAVSASPLVVRVSPMPTAQTAEADAAASAVREIRLAHAAREFDVRKYALTRATKLPKNHPKHLPSRKANGAVFLPYARAAEWAQAHKDRRDARLHRRSARWAAAGRV